MVFVFAKDGYIGNAVAMEIAYAYAMKKKLISSERINEKSIAVLVNEIVNADELIKYLNA